MKQYIEIIFFQGDDAEEPLEILEEQGEQACLEYCAQWDCGDSPYYSDTPPWGADDDLYQDGIYILSYNARLGYVGLCRVEVNTEIAS